MMNGGAASWKSSKYETTADSTTEVECIISSEEAKGKGLDKEVHC